MLRKDSLFQLFGWKLKPDVVAPPPEPIKILPYDVRYALKYRGGDINASEVLSLTNNWMDEAVYASIKMLAQDLSAQKNLLGELCEVFLKEEYEGEVKLILEKYLSHVDAQVTTNVKKLAEISRMGSEHAGELLLKTMQGAADKKPECSLLFLAYTSFIALREIVLYAKEQGKNVFFVVPEWLEDEQIQIMGYSFDGSTSQVSSISKAEQDFLPSHVVILDDSVRTGSSFGKIQRYWEENFQLQLGEDQLFVGKELQ